MQLSGHIQSLSLCSLGIADLRATHDMHGQLAQSETFLNKLDLKITKSKPTTVHNKMA